ncbi:MAG: type III secretion system cytoplasmic ring protein SctQ [Candidatus Competibacteraceae bacterium]|nr:type III secretion system cytoplasmic ring protein SctQ [Candidatus Competibacteraceae bacterium]
MNSCLLEQRPQTTAGTPSGCIQPLQLATIPRATLTWRNRLAACSWPLSIALDDDTYRLQLLPDFVLGDWPPAVVLRISIDHHPCWLLCSDFPLSVRWQSYCQAAELAELPNELRTMVCEAALAPMLEMVERVLGVSVHVVEWAEQQAPILEPIEIGFVLQASASNRFTGALVCEENLRPLLMQALERWPMAPLERWDGLRAQVLCEVGDTRLTVAEMAQLGLGDVLLLQHCRYLQDRSVAVRITPHLAPRARFSAGKWIIESLRPETTLMEQNTPLVDTDELAVPLTFSIGELAIPFGELRRLQPGYAFELERGLDRLVTIHSHGQRIGVGELIKIDGRAGVRIVELSRSMPDG